MADHIVSVDDDYNFPAPVMAMIQAMVDDRAKIIANGADWIDLTLLNGWENGSTNSVARYRLGGEGDKMYLEFRGSLKSPGGQTAIATFTDIPTGSIPNLKTFYGTSVNNASLVSLRASGTSLTAITAPSAGVVVSIDGIRVYL